MSTIPDPSNLGYPAAVGAFAAREAGNTGAIEELNSLLRGEISASETYAMAIQKCSASDKARLPDVQTLRDIQEEHSRTCQMLRGRIRELGGEASDSSGAWGAWAKTVEGTANLFGDKASLKALKEGEEHGLKDYQSALDRVDTESATLIGSEFIPAQERHIKELNTMLNSIGRA